MESALGAALGGHAKKTTYRRAWGASRDAKDETALPDRPAIASIQPLAKEQVAALASPILSLVGEMQFTSVMGASTQVIVVDIDSALSVAFIAATESRVSSVLLWDGSANTFAGMLTVTDYIRILLHCHEQGATAADTTASMSIRELLKTEWIKSCRGGLRTTPSTPFVWGTPNLSVLDCLGAMIQHRVNRLPILASKAFEEEPMPPNLPMGVVPGAPTSEVPPPPPMYSVISVLTFPQLLAHIGRVLLTSGGHSSTEAASAETLYDVPLKALTVGRHIHSIKNGTIPFITRDNTVHDALRVMIDQQVHAVCIRDSENSIVDVVTRSDVLRMESGGAYDVTQQLGEALSWRPAVATPVVCSLNDSFGDVLSHFVSTWVKEMFVVDPETDAVLGQLSMKELLQFLFDTMRDSTAPSPSRV